MLSSHVQRRALHQHRVLGRQRRGPRAEVQRLGRASKALRRRGSAAPMMTRANLLRGGADRAAAGPGRRERSSLPLRVTLYTAIGNPEVRDTLPRTTAALRAWDGAGLPAEAAFAAIAAELATAQERPGDRAAVAPAQLRAGADCARCCSRPRARRTASPRPTGRRSIALDARWARPAAVAADPPQHVGRTRRSSCCARST